MSAPLGAGHYAAAKALKEAFNFKYPEIEAEIVDVFDFTFRGFKKTVSEGFVFINSKIPFFYKWLYSNCNEYIQQKVLNNLSYSIVRKNKFIDFIKEFNPDFILSTNPLPAQLISLTKQKHLINILSANVCTDFGFHSLWQNPDVNYYFVANEEIKESLIKNKVDSEKIQISGIPISLKFKKEFDKEKIIRELGFDNKNPVLLIVGGKIKYHKLLKIVEGLKEKNNLAQFIIVAGRDNELKNKLETSVLKNDNKIKIFGFVDNIEDFMAVSDLILTKAGGLTMAECLAMNLPVVVEEIIPGQEEDNANYLILNGAGERVKNMKETIDKISGLFLERKKLAKMRENCDKIKKPDSALKIADFVFQKLNK